VEVDSPSSQGYPPLFPLIVLLLNPAEPWWGSGCLQGRTPYPRLGGRACNVTGPLSRASSAVIVHYEHGTPLVSSCRFRFLMQCQNRISNPDP
jgi:hypothetical protein